MDLPVWNAILKDEADGIIAISLVDMPAVMSNFVLFNKNDKYQKFEINNEEQHLITGVVMLADVPIYRRDGDYEYYLVFSKDTIKKMAEKMLKIGTQNNIDLQHNGKMIDGVNLVELFIKDSSKGITPNFISEDIPDGSLMATFHVVDEELWQILHTDEINGFSIEGFFSYEMVQMRDNNKINKNNAMNKIKEAMSKIEDIIKSALMTFRSVSTDKGVLNWANDEDLAVDFEVYALDENGEKVDVEDGDYVSEDGTIISVAGGKVIEIKAKEDVVEEPVEAEDENSDEKPAEEPIVEPVEKPIVEEPVVEPEEEDLKAEIEALKAEIEALKERISALESAPASEPIVEEFNAVKRTNENLSKGAKKAASILANLNN